jgi:hypothetical protein
MHACLLCLTHSSSVLMRTILYDFIMTAQSLPPGCARPTAVVSWLASRPSSASTYLRTHSACLDAASTMHWTDPSGLGLMRRGLFESEWLGSQAFSGTTAFNANIGAWNTAAMTTMASVCPHRPCALVTSPKIALGWRLHNRRSFAPSPWSSASTSLYTHSAHRTRRAQCTDPSRRGTGSCGSGSLRARGSACRRFTGRRRSTRTSEPGTLLR